MEGDLATTRTVCLTPQQDEALRQIARESDKSVSALVRDAVVSLLDKQPRQVEAQP